MLFFYSNRILIFQLKILAMDRYTSFADQSDWSSSEQIKIYVIAFFSILFINKMVLSDTVVFFFMGSIWVPQIYKNAYYNYRNTPNIAFAMCQSVHSVFIPVYIKGTQGNFMALKPHYSFVLLVLCWIGIQLIFLKIQKTRPRFMLPQFVKDRLNSGVYRYHTTFEEDAGRSSGSFLSNITTRASDTSQTLK